MRFSIFTLSHLHKRGLRTPYYTTHQNVNFRRFSSSILRYYVYCSSFTQPTLLLPSSSSLALTLTWTGNPGAQNRSACLYKAILSFFLLPRFSILAVSESLINRGKSGSLKGVSKQRNQIQLYNRVSRSCLVKTPHLVALLQVNNQDPVSSTGPWHTFTSFYRMQRWGQPTVSGFRGIRGVMIHYSR